MKTKRLTLESFKAIVKKIIKEEMYRNPEEKSNIVQNDRVKSLELSKGTIVKLEKNGFIFSLDRFCNGLHEKRNCKRSGFTKGIDG
jgi:hypothetical protein